MASRMSDIEKAEKAVIEAQAGVYKATAALRDAEAVRDALLEEQAMSDSQTLAQSVQAYQRSQKEFRASRLAKREEVRRMLDEVIQ